MYRRLLLQYLLAFFVTIALGLLSRKISFIPLIMGDLLYAVMAYWLGRIMMLKKNPTYALCGAIIFCFCIEFLQLVQVEPLIAARQHPFLRLIFGQGFLWSDLIAYCVGATVAYGIDLRVRKK